MTDGTTTQPDTEQPARHFLASPLLQPPHPLTVLLIGAGGTGSQVLTGLARMNQAMTALGHPGLTVRVLDGDRVTEANLGRQLYAYSELYLNKAEVLVNRTNRFFGTNWKALPIQYGPELLASPAYQGDQLPTANLILSCVDTVEARQLIANRVAEYGNKQANYSLQTPYYWLDWGNSQHTGQVLLSTVSRLHQPNSTTYRTIAHLPLVTEEYGDALRTFEQDNQQEPSCSLAEALTRQELFINPTLAQLGLTLLWQLFRQGMTAYRGVFVNLETLRSAPIPV